MRIAFVHTPMSTVPVPQRRQFWRNFDIQYHSTHPGLRHMRHAMWELPHWMHWLGGVLVWHGHTDLDVVDLYTAPGAVDSGGKLDEAVVRAMVGAHPADAYLFSPMTVNLHFAYQIADAVKQLRPQAKVIFGGVVATPLADRVARHPSVDFVVVERGETALPALIDALAQGRGVDGVGNLVHRLPDGRIARSGLRYPDLSAADIPPPKVDLFPPDAGQDIRYLRQVYALGCPYKCTFCTIQTIGQKPEYFSIDRVINEIRAYRERYGEHHNIYWGDETFTLHPERTLELLTALEDEGGIAYDCQTRLNCLGDDRVLKKLHDSGCRWVEIGLETGAQDSQNVHKHHMKLGSVEETLLRVRDAGLAACAFAVNGFPDQTPDQMRGSIEWICDLIDRDLLQASYLFGLVPYPGSAMFQHPERFGMELLHEDFALYHEELPPVYRTALASPDQVYEVFLDGLGMLAEAMGKRPYFGSLVGVGADERYGSFWADAHV
ncbi:B12-binding domain-containing radical SAM protein [Catenulispora sp. NF23]|uniref:B12-binding domain-containing radical SAM protein n=1 Tax=Catenulispora pinistramenti TaxID=2705254 RepID=A0ABS5KL55_9ACTN|nr:radical SAM protein [Catenulispora pinistramenti]MBS2532042.1 B12-binding domain-containing radical SAM protein [Catenulispora pinistramenti]MBS2546760.1 B12-binding domain-containing radical SAM protein [Catenulispora pinistramenti]